MALTTEVRPQARPTSGSKGRPRRTPTRNELALRGLIALLVIVVVVEAVRLHSSGVWGGPPQVTA